MNNTPKQYNFAEVTDNLGINRLTLYYISNMYQGKECGSNFDSLVWSILENDNWRENLTISEKEFDSNPKYQ